MASNPKIALQDRLVGVSETIEAILAAGGVPGAVVAIGQRGEIIHEASYGLRDIRKGLPPDTKTLFGLASITKTFTSAAISILVDEGKLDWTTPIRTILPGLNSTVPRITRELTIVDLLSHQAGLCSRNEWWYGSDSVLLVDREQELPLFNSLQPVAEFRSKYNYSNYGYGLAGLVIEKLSGLSFADFLQQRLLNPLGMRSTTARGLDLQGDNIATPYTTLDDLSVSILPQPAVTGETVMAGAQAVRSNAEDLIKWGHALISAARSESESSKHHTPGSPLKFVSNMMAKKITRRPGEFDQSYGLGFYRNQLPCDFVGVGPNAMFVEQMPTVRAREGHPTVLLHPGSMAGYYTYFDIIPELDITLVVLTNAPSCSKYPICASSIKLALEKTYDIERTDAD